MSRRQEYDKLIASGNYPDILTGVWSKDKEIFIQMQVANELLESDFDDDDDNDFYLDDEYIGY